MSSEMRQFIFAIFATLVVVASANKDLLRAVSNRNLMKVRILLKRPHVEVDFTTRVPCGKRRDRTKMTNPLLRALEFSPFDRKAEAITMALIQAGANPNALYSNGSTALHMACKHGNIKVVNELLKRNADIEATHPDDGRPLHIVITKDHTELALFIIKNYKPDLEAKKLVSLRTPLQQACYYENVAVVEALLDANVNLEALDAWGETAMHVAASVANIEIMTILKKMGAKVNFGNGIKPLLHKTLYGAKDSKKNLEAATTLIESFGANIDDTDKDGYSTLHIAVLHGNWEMIIMLMAHGANPHLKNHEDVSPNDTALKKWDDDLRILYNKYRL